MKTNQQARNHNVVLIDGRPPIRNYMKRLEWWKNAKGIIPIFAFYNDGTHLAYDPQHQRPHRYYAKGKKWVWIPFSQFASTQGELLVTAQTAIVLQHLGHDSNGTVQLRINPHMNGPRYEVPPGWILYLSGKDDLDTLLQYQPLPKDAITIPPVPVRKKAQSLVTKVKVTLRFDAHGVTARKG